MKLKENKGMSLIVLTIILAVLVVVAIGVIVYLLKNPVKEKVGTQINMENNLVKENIEIQNTLNEQTDIFNDKKNRRKK